MQLTPSETEQRLGMRIKRFFAEQGKTRVVLGLSGGIDSAVTFALLCKALGKENVTCLIMPNTKISSASSTRDAEKFAKQLKVHYFVVPIDKVVNLFSPPWKQSGVALANLNARARAMVLYNYANSFDALVAGTGNKTEFYLGYFTKYGDAAADFFPISNLLKKEVRALASCLGVPREIIEKPPSAELWPGQEDEKELGITYAEVDELLPLILASKEVPPGKKGVADRIRAAIKATEHKRQAPKFISLDGE